MAQWKLRKDKLQADAAKGETAEETGEAIVGEEDGAEEGPSPAFSLHDTAVEELAFAPDPPMAQAPSPHALDLAGEAHGHDSPEEPHFLSAGPTFVEPAFTALPPLEPAFAEEAPAFSPFVPFQPEEPQPAPRNTLSRDEIAFGLVTPGGEGGIPRVAPFIVDVPPAAEEATTGASLVIRIGNLSANFTLTKEVTTIGRPDSAAQSYPDVEIELDDAVSRRHAAIHRRDGDYYLVDTMSTNGTLLNGQRVASDQEQRLMRGDQIRMGDRTEIIFE